MAKKKKAKKTTKEKKVGQKRVFKSIMTDEEFREGLKRAEADLEAGRVTIHEDDEFPS